MNNQQRIEIAKGFVSLHKADNVNEWAAGDSLNGHFKQGDPAYLAVYDKLIGCVYGDVTCPNSEYDDDGDIIKCGTLCEIEINSHESKSGHSIIFTWEDDSQ